MGVLDFFGNLSPEAQAALIQGGLGFGSGLMSGAAQGKMDDATRNWQWARDNAQREYDWASAGASRDFAAQQAGQGRTFDWARDNANRAFQRGGDVSELEQGLLGLDRAGASQVLSGTQMGEIPSIYSQLALKRALFSGLPAGATTANLTSLSNVPSEFAQFMPTVSGGISLGPAKAAMEQYLSDDVLKADLSRRLSAEARVDPKGQTFDMGTMFGAGAAPQMAQIAQTKTNTMGDIEQARARSLEALSRALNPEQPTETAWTNPSAPTITPPPQSASQEGGKKSFFGKLLSVAAPFTSLIPGVGPILGPILSAGVGATGGALSGGAKGAVLGGAGGYLGGKLMPSGATNPMSGGVAPRNTPWRI